MANEVKFKYGLKSDYDQLQNKDSDTLYCITDKHLIYKGAVLITGQIEITTSTGNGTAGSYVTLSITDNATNQVYTITAYTQAAIEAIYTTINNHVSLDASNTVKGHTYLDDVWQNATKNAADDVTAATPLAVWEAYQAACSYADSLVVSGIDAMVFKGTLGSGGTVQTLPAIHNAGDTYMVATAGTYAGKECEVGDFVICVTTVAVGGTPSDSDWTVLQNNLIGAVTTTQTLDANSIILGNGSKTVKTLSVSAALNGKVLSVVNGAPQWADAPSGAPTWTTIV